MYSNGSLVLDLEQVWRPSGITNREGLQIEKDNKWRGITTRGVGLGGVG